MQPPATPIIVDVTEAPVNELEGLADVAFNAVGLTGLFAITALLLGFVLAGTVIAYRKARAGRMTDEEAAQTQSLGLTPTGRR